MGTVSYDGSKFELSDRLSAHLQVIISLKVRRNEGFFVFLADPGIQRQWKQRPLD